MNATERIAEIRARLEEATPGPWELYASGHTIAVTKGRDRNGYRGEVVHWSGFDSSTVDPKRVRANAALIAHAPADIAFLLDYVEVLERAHRLMPPAKEWNDEGQIAAYEAGYLTGFKVAEGLAREVLRGESVR